MRITQIISIFFIIMVIVETFYPLGDIMLTLFGVLGAVLGLVILIAGILSLSYEITKK